MARKRSRTIRIKGPKSAADEWHCSALTDEVLSLDQRRQRAGTGLAPPGTNPGRHALSSEFNPRVNLQSPERYGVQDFRATKGDSCEQVGSNRIPYTPASSGATFSSYKTQTTHGLYFLFLCKLSRLSSSSFFFRHFNTKQGSLLDGATVSSRMQHGTPLSKRGSFIVS